jgi:hypothetical protein
MNIDSGLHRNRRAYAEVGAGTMNKSQKDANLFAMTAALAVLAFCIVVFPTRALAQNIPAPSPPEHLYSYTPQNGVSCTVYTFYRSSAQFIQTVCTRVGGGISISTVKI